MADSLTVHGIGPATGSSGSIIDANANAVAIQHITIENEGWMRDHTTTPPPEPVKSK